MKGARKDIDFGIIATVFYRLSQKSASLYVHKGQNADEQLNSLPLYKRKFA